jgi:uncharacterized surface protein with fasciclin (FAS1) repeats
VNDQRFPRLCLSLAGVSLLGTVLMLPALTNTPLVAAPAAIPSTQIAQATSNSNTIVDVAVANPDFTTLVKAVKAAGMGKALAGNGPFTVFAPTNQAFAALPQETVETLMKPENKKKLRKLLSYHVVSGNLASSQLKSGEIMTVAGSPVMLSISGGKVKINNANVIGVDIKASNGVIHVVDRVILPPGF